MGKQEIEHTTMSSNKVSLPTARSVVKFSFKAQYTEVHNIILRKTNEHNFKSMFTRRTICILAKTNIAIMSLHEEPQQNEIGGPVTFALIVFAIVILAITFLV